jgi:disulfide bond formation protein DsbB
MKIPSRRTLNVAGFLACAGMMAYALYAQYALLLEPCPLCIFQRVAVIMLGIVLLVAALHDPAGRSKYVYAVMVALSTVAGAGFAGWHVRLQHLPPDNVPSCGPGLNYMLDNFPLGEALKMVFTGSGECANIDWQLLGLSMPAWVLIAVLAVGGMGIWNNLRNREIMDQRSPKSVTTAP